MNSQIFLPKKVTRCFAYGILPIWLAACATPAIISETPTSIELEPMEMPTELVSQRIHQINKVKGEETYYEFLKINEDGTQSGRNSEGCQWVNFGDYISPATSWENCSKDAEWHSGENRDMSKKGEIWPLTVGNKVSYSYTQVNALGEVTGRKVRKCKVIGSVNIEVAAGNLDTFKVDCKRTEGSWSTTRTFYISPELGRTVKYVKTSSSNGLEDDTEFLRVEQL